MNFKASFSVQKWGICGDAFMMRVTSSNVFPQRVSKWRVVSFDESECRRRHLESRPFHVSKLELFVPIVLPSVKRPSPACQFIPFASFSPVASRPFNKIFISSLYKSALVISIFTRNQANFKRCNRFPPPN